MEKNHRIMDEAEVPDATSEEKLLYYMPCPHLYLFSYKADQSWNSTAMQINHHYKYE